MLFLLYRNKTRTNNFCTFQADFYFFSQSFFACCVPGRFCYHARFQGLEAINKNHCEIRDLLCVFLLYRPIPFEDVLTILVSIFLLKHVERIGRESVRPKWRKKIFLHPCLKSFQMNFWSPVTKSADIFKNAVLTEKSKLLEKIRHFEKFKNFFSWI